LSLPSLEEPGSFPLEPLRYLLPALVFNPPFVQLMLPPFLSPFVSSVPSSTPTTLSQTLHNAPHYVPRRRLLHLHSTPFSSSDSLAGASLVSVSSPADGTRQKKQPKERLEHPLEPLVSAPLFWLATGRLPRCLPRPPRPLGSRRYDVWLYSASPLAGPLVSLALIPLPPSPRRW
jgi:hypothetical protein